MTTVKRSLLMLAMLALLYSVSACASVFAPDSFLLRKPTTFILLAYSLALTMFFSDHIIEPQTRRYLVGIAGLITLWTVLRGAKYIAFEETEVVARHIWYLYYIPALLIPLLSLLAALSVGMKHGFTHRRAVLLASLVTLLLLVLLLTNDLHQLVFRFRPGFESWDSDYTRSPVFYLLYGWITLLFICVICVLISRCRISAGRRLVWIPLLPALFGTAYFVLYTAGYWGRVNGDLFGEFPEAVCFTTAGIWLSFISIGLIPSNIGYGRLFELSGISAQIADRDWRVIYKSTNAEPLSARELSSGTVISPNTNTRIHRRPVHGGFVYWQDDISELNRLNRELWETGEQLAEEAELLRLENELKEERAQIEEKTRTYDEIAAKVLAQSQKISALCEEAERRPESYAAKMKTVCMLAAYIKRFANLSLLAADSPYIDAAELYLAVQESLRYVSDMGIAADCSLSQAGGISAQTALYAYALFERLLEQALPTLRGVQAHLAGDVLKCVFEGAELALPEGCCAVLAAEDGSCYVHIPLREAGEAS